MEASGRLSSKGVAEEMAKAYADAGDAHKIDMREVEREMAEATRQLGELATCGVPAIKESDSVSELRDQELRRFWRSLDAEERANLHTDMELGKHQDLAIALLRGPAVVAGLLSNRRQRMQEALIPEARRNEAETIRLRLQRFEAAHHALRAGDEAARLHARLNHSDARAARGELGPAATLAAEKKAEREARAVNRPLLPQQGQ